MAPFLESNVKVSENYFELMPIGLRIVTSKMMREATGSRLIGTTPTYKLLHCQQHRNLKKGVTRQDAFKACLKALLTPHHTDDTLFKYVKRGACAMQFLSDIGYEPLRDDKAALSMEMAFEFTRACLVRQLTVQEARYYRAVIRRIVMLTSPNQDLTKIIENDLQTSFGLSPCNNKPVQFDKRPWWFGDAREVAGFLHRLPFDEDSNSNQFVAVMILAGAFKLSLRAAASASVEGGGRSIRLSGSDDEQNITSRVIAPQTPYEQWGVEALSKLLNRAQFGSIVFSDAKAASKFVLRLEAMMQRAGFLPADTDFVFPVMPEVELRHYVDRFLSS